MAAPGGTITRCERIFLTAKGSVMVAMTRIFLSHFGQRSASKPKERCSSTAQSTRTREDIAKSSPSMMRFQCFTVMIVGSSKATSTACASDAFDGNLDEIEAFMFLEWSGCSTRPSPVKHRP
jgi:hypothetical protein